MPKIKIIQGKLNIKTFYIVYYIIYIDNYEIIINV